MADFLTVPVGSIVFDPTTFYIYLSVFGLLTFAFFILAFLSMPFYPFFFAMITKKTVVGQIGKDGVIKARSVDYKNQMYSFPQGLFSKDMPLRWVKQYPGVYRWAGVNVDFIHGDLAWVMKAELSGAFQELIDQGYKNMDEVMVAIRNKKFDPSGLTMPLFFKIPWNAIERYSLDVPPSAIMGQIEDGVHMAQQKQEKGEYSWALPLAMVIIAACIGVAILYMVMK